MTTLELTDVTVCYGERIALERATLALESGRVTALIGSNGSGKSTLFAAVIGSVPLAHGTVRIGGRDARTARRAGDVAFVPQSESIDPTFPLSVRETVLMGRYGRLGPTRRPGKVDRAAVDEALHRVDLTALADRPIGQLSGGQRKRTFVARALAQEAPLLLLDEPFAGVDTRSEALITDVLHAVAATGGTVLVSTHALASLDQLATDAIVLRRSILFHGTVAEALQPQRWAVALGLETDASESSP